MVRTHLYRTHLYRTHLYSRKDNSFSTPSLTKRRSLHKIRLKGHLTRQLSKEHVKTRSFHLLLSHRTLFRSLENPSLQSRDLNIKTGKEKRNGKDQ